MNTSSFSTANSTANFYPAQGDILDSKYEVEHILGEGGMGAVAKAIHLLRRAPVALKFMSPAVVSVPGAVERFINEGVAASQIDSDHVVKIFDVGRLPSGAPYLVMEFLEGHDLSSVIEREGHPGIESARAVHFVLQALRGLQVAHAAGIVHRDMKPSNCFVITKDGEPDFVKLVDFGISKVNQEGGQKITRTNSALGTPVYMSPEQARSPRDVDLRSDLYSVGVVLYELLSGRTPFTSETGEFTEILFKIFTEEPPPLKSFVNVSDGLAAAVHRALVRDVATRYSSAAEMGEALAPFADARSHHVLQRLRQYETSRLSRASALPAMSGPVRSRGGEHGFTPASLEARVSPSEAMDRTQVGASSTHRPSSPPAANARSNPPPAANARSNPPPPAVATNIGVSKDAPRTEAKRPLGATLAIAAAIAIPAAAVGVWASGVFGGRTPVVATPSTVTAPVEPRTTTTAQPIPVAPPVTVTVAAFPSAEPAPTAVPSATKTAEPVKQVVPQQSAPKDHDRRQAPPPSQLPNDLGGVGFH